MLRAASHVKRALVSPPRLALALSMVLAPLSVVLFAQPASAGVPTCGMTLTASLTLTGPLNCSTYTSGPDLIIGASGITVNLNGKTLTSDDEIGIEVGAVSLKAYADVTIEDGTITGAADGVYVNAARALILRGLTIVSPSLAYEGVYAKNVAGGSFSALNVTDTNYGVYLDGSSQVTVTGSKVTSSETGFYDTYSTDDTYSADIASGFGTTIGYDGFYGYYSYGETYMSDVANGDYDGFDVYNDGYGPATLKDNTADSNYNSGFLLYENYGYYASEVVEGNTANLNEYYGFYDYDSYGATWSQNTADHNQEYGIYLYYPYYYTVSYNTTSDNDGTGLYLYDNDSYYNVKTASGNTANGNGDYGFYGEYAAPDTGAVNNATNNTPYDCYNFVCDASAT